MFLLASVLLTATKIIYQFNGKFINFILTSTSFESKKNSPINSTHSKIKIDNQINTISQEAFYSTSHEARM